MTEQNTGDPWADLTPTAIPAEDGDASAAVTTTDPATGASVYVRDFTDYAAALAQAKAIGGTVVPSGVAFHVES